MRRLLWILLFLAASVVPLGQAIDINQDFSPSSETLMISMNNGAQENSFSSPGGYISPTFSYQEGGLVTASKDDLDIMQIYHGYDDSDFLLTNSAFSYLLTNNENWIRSYNNVPLDLDSSASNTLSADPAKKINSNLLSLYRSVDSEDNNLIAIKDVDANKDSTARYYYEKSDAKDSSYSLNDLTHKVNLDLDYIYQRSSRTSAAEDKETSVGSRKSDEDSLKYLYDISTTSSGSKDNSILKAQTKTNLNAIIQGSQAPYENPFEINGQTIVQKVTKDQILLDEKKKSLKKYAVVVGINNYTDRNSLHTSVNDAETMAALLEAYGYNVVKLTDTTDEKPTKTNILEKALGEMKGKNDIDKVIIYFSGHGEKNGGDYYLIPQDGDGDPSSYISTKDLKESIEGLKSVAIVVDACNAGSLEDIIGNGQMVMVSSKEDQASNEIWFGSLSLFTSNLCNAIREEEKTSNTVLLERCFYKAKEATERWSSWHLLDQDPQIKDKTEGYFSLN